MIEILKAKKAELEKEIASLDERKAMAQAKIDAYDEVIKDLGVVPVVDEEPVVAPVEVVAEEPTVAAEPTEEHIIRISQSGF